MKKIALTLLMLGTFFSSNIAGAAIVHTTDSSITGSLCVGFDCLAAEAFGFNTIKLKENNLRIGFVDTSTTGSFPSNDWEITINDSANGGINKFSITDTTGGKIPFTIEAAAPTNSLYVDSSGRLGLGTSNPLADIHEVSGNTPTLRLEQDGSSGFTPQTWDMAGNEANFFIRDATNGSTLPFRIFPGAPSNAITIEATTGDVGLGTIAPTSALHVQRSDGSAKMLIEETNATVVSRPLIQYTNNGGIRMQFTNTGATPAKTWGFVQSNAGGAFLISLLGSGQTEMQVNSNGNLIIAGTLTQGSSRDIKKDFKAVDGGDILTKLDALPITTWTYKKGKDGIHLGPVAEDFSDRFGLGMDDKHIAPGDMAGIAMVGVKELHAKVKVRGQRIEELEQRIKALEDMLASMATELKLEKASFSY